MAGTRFASTSKRLGLLIRARFGSIVAVKGFAFALAPPAGRGTEDPHEEGEWGDAPKDEGQHDARGAPLVLNGGERRELRVGDRVLDLSAPIEWRGIVFQEGLGQAIAVYQGTWIRQGSTEIVLVSLLPSLMSAGAQGIAENGSLAGLDRSVLRDLRLMQAVPEEPPPVEQRVAIDRLFMLPVRYALDRAPRPSKHSMGRAQRQD